MCRFLSFKSPHVPHVADDSSASNSSHIEGGVSSEGVPPGVNEMMLMRGRAKVLHSLAVDHVPNGHSKGALLAKVRGGFRVREI